MTTPGAKEKPMVIVNFFRSAESVKSVDQVHPLPC
jgi:hypothetical protein